jgi:hypothetical protein
MHLRNPFARNDPFGPRAPCALAANSSAVDVIAYLNQNTARVNGWRATNVEIRMRGAAGILPATAMIAVEAPRNFRLLARGPTGGPEFDLGSNSDQFWVWNKRDERREIVTARHDQETLRERRYPVPFEPDWLMEALGVVEIDPAEVTAHPGQERSKIVQLVSNRTSPRGQPVRKVTLVDTCHGIVREHALYDAQGQLIARAVLSGHIRDPATGVVLPTRIEFNWPQASVGLTMSLGHVEVNPRGTPPQTWHVPDYPGYRVIDLSR